MSETYFATAVFQINWYWVFPSLISLLVAVHLWRMGQQHQMADAESEHLRPRWGLRLMAIFRNGTEMVTFEGRPLARHSRREAVHALWDKRNLYLAFDVHSSNLLASVRERDGNRLWEDNGVEFVNPLLQRTKEFMPDDFSYHINILNTVYDDRGTPSGQRDPQSNGNAPIREPMTILTGAVSRYFMIHPVLVNCSLRVRCPVELARR